MTFSESTTNRLFSLLVIIWGAVLVYFYVSQRVFKYLAPDFHLLVLIGGLGLLVLGVFCLLGLKEKNADCGHHHHGDHGHDHEDHEDHEDCCGHHHDGHGPLTVFLITLVPLGLALASTNDRMSPEAALKKGAYEAPNMENMGAAPLFSLEMLDDSVEKTAEGEYELSLIMAYYAAEDPEVRKVFEGLPVKLEGRLIPEKNNNPDGTRRRLYRLYISCCAADGQAVGLTLAFDQATPEPADDTWAAARGILHYEEIEGVFQPVVQVEKLEASEEPYSEFILR